MGCLTMPQGPQPNSHEVSSQYFVFGTITEGDLTGDPVQTSAVQQTASADASHGGSTDSPNAIQLNVEIHKQHRSTPW